MAEDTMAEDTMAEENMAEHSLAEEAMAEETCTCLICGNNTSTMQLFPKKEDVAKKWLEFLYERQPATYCKTLVLCSTDFDNSDFKKFGTWGRGFALRFLLKPGSAQRQESSSQEVSKL